MDEIRAKDLNKLKNLTMEIYKITNKINNKIYIGKVYNRSTMDRFKRHCDDAKPNTKSLIDKAIYKYGKESFIVEIID